MQKKGKKIELALIDDLKITSNKLAARSMELTSNVQNILDLKNNLNSLYSELMKASEAYSLIERNYKNSLNDLGLPYQEIQEQKNAKSKFIQSMNLYKTIK